MERHALAELPALAADARFALLGEATHGTYDFYAIRAELTRRLIVDHGYRAVAIEGDWPDAWRVDRYVRGLSGDADADEALSGFRRFPTWMWRNTVVRDFVEWLRDWNDERPADDRAGFYGLDLYSLYASIEAVLDYLERVSPEAAERARERYACFEQAGGAESYAYAAGFGAGPSCEDEAVTQLVELMQRGRGDDDEFFAAERNAAVVARAEEYYRTMFRGRAESWNLRDTHMVETLLAVAEHTGARVVVWAHNSHLGDARATELGEHGELNVGQLVRERCGRDAVLIGFTTYDGTVTAASSWGGEPELKRVRPALPGSWESLLHEGAADAFWTPAGDVGVGRRLERAIGVVYLPQTERVSHYFHAALAQQFDALVHVDRTRALEPLEPTERWRVGEEEPAEALG